MKKIAAFLTGGALGGYLVYKLHTRNKIITYNKWKKFEALYDLLDRWLVLKEEGKSLEQILLDKGYHRIAIYGMADVGGHMYHELRGSRIEVCYGIDRRNIKWYEDLEVVSPEGPLKKVDAIIITAVMDYQNIKDLLEDKVDDPVLTIEEILYEGM